MSLESNKEIEAQEVKPRFMLAWPVGVPALAETWSLTSWPASTPACIPGRAQENPRPPQSNWKAAVAGNRGGKGRREPRCQRACEPAQRPPRRAVSTSCGRTCRRAGLSRSTFLPAEAGGCCPCLLARGSPHSRCPLLLDSCQGYLLTLLSPSPSASLFGASTL